MSGANKRKGGSKMAERLQNISVMKKTPMMRIWYWITKMTMRKRLLIAKLQAEVEDRKEEPHSSTMTMILSDDQFNNKPKVCSTTGIGMSGMQHIILLKKLKMNNNNFNNYGCT